MTKLQAATAALLVILAAVLISGCTFFGGNIAAGSGVVIENFEVSPLKDIYASEAFELRAKIRNIGASDAENVFMKLYNVESVFGGNKIEISCIERFDLCASEEVLLAPDQESGTVGETKTCTWDCIAPPNIPEGISVTFNPSMRTYYMYKTSTIKAVNIASQEELISLETRGESLPLEDVSTTSGPVSMEIVVNGPIRYWSGEGKINFPINIKIQNIGGGVVCNPEQQGCQKTDNWNKAKLFFESDVSVNLICNSGIPERSMLVDLWKSQAATLTCEIEMPVPPGSTAKYIQKNLIFKLEYDYFVDASTSVNVIGRKPYI
jgi:hypothetical protein